MTLRTHKIMTTQLNQIKLQKEKNGIQWNLVITRTLGP